MTFSVHALNRMFDLGISRDAALSVAYFPDSVRYDKKGCVQLFGDRNGARIRVVVDPFFPMIVTVSYTNSIAKYLAKGDCRGAAIQNQTYTT